MANIKSEHEDYSEESILEDKSASIEDESEDSILQVIGKLYIHEEEEEEGKQWKERGDGVLKFLKHKESGRVRLLMRRHDSQSQHVMLIIPVHYTSKAAMQLEEYGGDENSCMWSATEYEDGKLKDKRFRIQFDSAEDWEAFIRRFEDVIETQSKKEENEDTDAAPGFLEKLTIDPAKTNEQKAHETISIAPSELKGSVSEEEIAQAN